MDMTIFLKYLPEAVLAALAVLVVVLSVFLVKKQRQYEELWELVEQKFAKEALKKEMRKEESGIYRKFVPIPLMQILGIQKTSDITENMQRTFPAAVLSMNIWNFEKIIHKEEPARVYRLLNRLFRCAMPRLQEAGMVIETFDSRGIRAISVENKERVLYAAVSVCEKIHCEKEEIEGQDICIGIGFGQVMAGIAGYEERLCAMTMSEASGIASYLQSVGAQFYASILVTSSFAEQVDIFEEQYSSRVLGYLLLSSEKRIEKIYDVFDGDEPAVKVAKRKTKRMFEKGVEAFVQARVEEARKCFIEVLKMDRYDCAAKEYVFLCDTYMEEGTKEAPLFFMVY